MTVFSKIVLFTRRHPIIRGMLSYAVLWPTSCIIQQSIAGKRWNNYDWHQVARFGLYGSFFIGPTLYGWVRISTILWPTITVKTAITKAVVEQLTYGPAALVSFYFGMSMLNNKTIDEGIQEIRMKFWPTYKVGVCVWPVLQTFNFLVIKERNRVPFVSMCSLVWGCFLSYMDKVSHDVEEQRIHQSNSSVLLSN
ncbi:hypothetical protein PPYR_11590 [Photinus pyralis]|uniref:Mpv17-like protein n=1 Tax=Photinus pyralis TaxID=7054 RepID=A0A1Y1KE00_PHOPY|nr:mpv17-like protein [Photinus pyralis]KAB0794751.1 hypothetical protein PPYR_11590 [Photinus pyralis]